MAYVREYHRGGSRGRVQGVRTPPEMTSSFLIQLVFCEKKITMWFIGVEVEQETSAPPPKKNPGSAPVPPPATNLSMFCVDRRLRCLVLDEIRSFSSGGSI